MRDHKLELKVGLFALALLLLIAYATWRVGDQSVVTRGGYPVTVVMDNAAGLKTKAPVELAGVHVGVVKKIELLDSRRARLMLVLDERVKLSKGTVIALRGRGYLGDTYLEIVPGPPGEEPIGAGAELGFKEYTGDFNQLVQQFGSIAEDIKAITKSIREMVGEDERAPIYRIVHHLDEFVQVLRDVSVRQETNVNKIVENIADLTSELRALVRGNRENVDESLDRIASITKKIDEGRGTVGKLINDDATVEKLNSAIDQLNETLGGYKKLQTEIGYHVEYLTHTSDFKNYVDLSLKPSPDKAFLFEVIQDSNPDSDRSRRESSVTVGATTTNVTTETSVTKRDSVLFSAQLAKSFYDLTLRGGVIESSGGMGADLQRGPLTLSMSAFDFETRFGEKPHLKAMGTMNLTNNLYLLGGADDMLNPQQKTDWFFGGGFRLVDEDVKSLFRTGLTGLIR